MPSKGHMYIEGLLKVSNKENTFRKSPIDKRP